MRNMSLLHDYFHQRMKKAKVVSIQMSGDKYIYTNNIAISLFPRYSSSKIFFRKHLEIKLKTLIEKSKI